MSGARTAFRKTGLREKECLYFLKMCSLGPPHIIKELLCDSEISEELMDSRGNNGLMFAAVRLILILIKRVLIILNLKNLKEGVFKNRGIIFTVT